MRENEYLINTIQEITLQAYAFGIYDYFFNERNMSRTDIFNIFVEWAKEFEETHKDFDWMQGSFYDEVDDFLTCRFDSIKIADKIRDAFPGGITKGDHISYEGGIFKVTGFTERGILVDEGRPCKDNEDGIVVEIGFSQSNKVKILPDYEEVISSWGDAHDATLRNKINHAWNINREGFAPILIALYARDINEITDHDAFQYKDWIDTDEYVNGDWTAYNQMALEKMKAEWDFYAANYLDHIADDCDLECILNFLHYPYLPCYK